MSCSHDYTYMAISAVVLILEAWLGKTNKVKAASTIELIFNLILSLLRFKPKQGE